MPFLLFFDKFGDSAELSFYFLRSDYEFKKI